MFDSISCFGEKHVSRSMIKKIPEINSEGIHYLFCKAHKFALIIAINVTINDTINNNNNNNNNNNKFE